MPASQLLTLLEAAGAAGATGRLKTLAIPNNEATFSVLEQGDTSGTTRQKSAVNFFPDTNQAGFKVGRSSSALSLAGVRKTDTSTSDFTGTTDADSPATGGAGFDTYAKYAADPARNKIGTGTSALLQQYYANDNTKTYRAKYSTVPGITLTYKSPTNY